MNEQNIGTITLEEALNLFCCPKIRENTKKLIEVSNGRYGPYIVMELLLFLYQRKTLWMLT
jgi:DNA topoisomerase-1